MTGLARLEQDGVLGAYRARDLLEALVAAPIERHPIAALLEGAWARRHEWALGDALYVELARSLGFVLVSTDPSLARAADPIAELVVSGRDGSR